MRKHLLAIAAIAILGQSVHAAESSLPANVIARQGGQQVTLQDIDAYAQKIPPADRPGFFDSPKRIQAVIENMLLQRQLAAEARAEKLDRDQQVKLQMQLASDDALARVQLDHIRDTAKLPDFEELASEYYASHKDEFALPGSVTVKHVLVSTQDRDDDVAKKRIGEVAAAAHSHPDQFDALIEKYSDDPSKKDNHGVIEDAASGKMVQPFAQAAAALKAPGDLSPITKTDYGYHVLKLVERKPATTRPFAEVHDALIEKLRKDFVDRQVTDHANKLRNNPLDANPDLVASLRTRFMPAHTAQGNAEPAQQKAADAVPAKP